MSQPQVQVQTLPTSDARRHIDLLLDDMVDPAPADGLEPAECKALSGWKAQDEAARVLTDGAEDRMFRRRLCFVAYLRKARGAFPSEG